VWVPLNSLGDGVQSDTGALPGEVVRIAVATTQGAAT
jgi:NADH-quinone oxidoreductase subunit G